jgi:hypothetical protein
MDSISNNSKHANEKHSKNNRKLKDFDFFYKFNVGSEGLTARQCWQSLSADWLCSNILIIGG